MTLNKENMTMKEEKMGGKEEEEEKMMMMMMMTAKLTGTDTTVALVFPCGDTALSQILHAILITSEVNRGSAELHIVRFHASVYGVQLARSRYSCTHN